MGALLAKIVGGFVAFNTGQGVLAKYVLFRQRRMDEAVNEIHALRKQNQLLTKKVAGEETKEGDEEGDSDHGDHHHFAVDATFPISFMPSK
eukprot:JP440006.1.p3 GENE.JP440006.1~~JP440006.1.p3  ORF type:complete len:91 (+),score=42.52 JP440006.1:1-273(+)